MTTDQQQDQTEAAGGASAVDRRVSRLVDRFLAWPLPESVASDQCATMPGYPHRSGTNLLTADEARQMFEYVLAEAEAGVLVHVTPAINERCDHDWEHSSDGEPQQCSKCGISFMRYIHSCCI